MKPAGGARRERAEEVRHNMARYVGFRAPPGNPRPAGVSMDGVRLRADWQAKAEEWLKKTSAPLIAGLDEMPWRTGRLS